MSSKRFHTAVTLVLLSLAAVTVRTFSQTAAPEQSKQEAQPTPQSNSQSSYVLKVTTRMVTLDVIATDSHGKQVRDLKKEDLQVFEEHNSRQAITDFQFVDRAARAAAGTSGAPANSGGNVRVFSNQLPVDDLKVSPTVLLMDGVNTQTTNQMQGRRHMLELLKTLPRDTPVAVFLLGSSLKVLQGFTSDQTLLRAAVDRVLTANNIDQDPADDPNSLSNLVDMDIDTTWNSTMVPDLQDFEKENYARTMDWRVRETIDALAEVAEYLSGIPGRKNLVWVSESFPISIVPNTDTGKDEFAGTRAYSDQIIKAANALTDAQVAVYPVDVVGLATQQAFSASTPTPTNRRALTGPQIAGRLTREETAHLQSQDTMDQLAKDTGGKTCKNTNDLSGCVNEALNDSSSYYEVGFYPQNVNWDGKFHNIVVKTTRPGIKLTYRRGYFALDGASLAKQQAPEERLREGCAQPLPATAIHITARAVPESQAVGPRGTLQYSVLLSAAGLEFPQAGEARNVNLQVAYCEFSGKSDRIGYSRQDLTRTISEDLYRKWQGDGIPYYLAIVPQPDTHRVRVVLTDGSTGLTGAIDIPVSAAEIARATAAAKAALAAKFSYVEIPDKEPTPAQPKPSGSLSFHASTGAAGSLDWNGETLLYRGDLTVEQTAGAFFAYAYGAKFRCLGGSLQPIDAAGAMPSFHFTFHGSNGKAVIVDLSGSEPEYLGDLAVEPSARKLFERVWTLSHCQAAH